MTDMSESKEQIKAELKDLITNLRSFCVSYKRECEAIREWAVEENYLVTNGMVNQVQDELTEEGLSDGSAINHKYYGA